MFDLHVNGPIGLLILIADIYAIVKTVQSNAGTLTKVLWIVAILFLPVLGFLLWLMFGPRSSVTKPALSGRVLFRQCRRR